MPEQSDTAKGDMKESPGYPRAETIRCPECGKSQTAHVHFENWMPFTAYVHECACGYTIMESEWERVSTDELPCCPDCGATLLRDKDILFCPNHILPPGFKRCPASVPMTVAQWKEQNTNDSDALRCSDPACPRHTQDLGKPPCTPEMT